MKYRQLSKEERYTIFSLLSDGYSKKHIAKILNRHTSTISREIKRNSTRVRYTHKTNPKYHYLPDSAQETRDIRRRQANARQPLKNDIVYNFVITHLYQYWSPDIISGVLKNKYQGSKKYNISHETIYKYIYTKEGEQQNLKQYLIRRHKQRRHYTGRKTQKLQKVQNTINITKRKNYFPKSETRQEFGHFEGDSILSMRTTYSAIRTEVERKTRYIIATKIPKKSADNVELATARIFENILKISNKTIKSTTWDNGTEHANHEKIAHKMNIKIFFADPYKSWQRGTNEHANGMIRRFFPKGTNFDNVTEEDLQKIIFYLNNRPRKIFNYRTSQELFDEEIKKILQQEKYKNKKLQNN